MFSWRQRFALAVTDVPVNAILTTLSAHPLRIIVYMTRVQSLWSYMASRTIFQESAQRVRTTVSTTVHVHMYWSSTWFKLNDLQSIQTCLFPFWLRIRSAKKMRMHVCTVYVRMYACMYVTEYTWSDQIFQ